MNTIEIELRYEIVDKNQLTQFLAPLKFLRSNQDIDIYYDNADAILYQKGIFIRNRNNKKLDIKFNRACLDNPDLAIQDYCEEHSFALPLQEKNLSRINELLVSLQLQPSPIADLEESLKKPTIFLSIIELIKYALHTRIIHSRLPLMKLSI